MSICNSVEVRLTRSIGCGGRPRIPKEVLMVRTTCIARFPCLARHLTHPADRTISLLSTQDQRSAAPGATALGAALCQAALRVRNLAAGRLARCARGLPKRIGLRLPLLTAGMSPAASRL